MRMLLMQIPSRLFLLLSVSILLIATSYFADGFLALSVRMNGIAGVWLVGGLWFWVECSRLSPSMREISVLIKSASFLAVLHVGAYTLTVLGLLPEYGFGETVGALWSAIASFASTSLVWAPPSILAVLLLSRYDFSGPVTRMMTGMAGLFFLGTLAGWFLQPQYGGCYKCGITAALGAVPGIGFIHQLPAEIEIAIGGPVPAPAPVLPQVYEIWVASGVSLILLLMYLASRRWRRGLKREDACPAG